MDDRDGMAMERPGSPVPRLRGQVVDENDDEDAKQKVKEDKDKDLKSALTFEPPPVFCSSSTIFAYGFFPSFRCF